MDDSFVRRVFYFGQTDAAGGVADATGLGREAACVPGALNTAIPLPVTDSVAWQLHIVVCSHAHTMAPSVARKPNEDKGIQ